MAQFASALHAQTNPTNKVLIAFRESQSKRSVRSRARSWSRWLQSPTPGEWRYVSAAQIDHARGVLTRLACQSR